MPCGQQTGSRQTTNVVTDSCCVGTHDGQERIKLAVWLHSEECGILRPHGGSERSRDLEGWRDDEVVLAVAVESVNVVDVVGFEGHAHLAQNDLEADARCSGDEKAALTW